MFLLTQTCILHVPNFLMNSGLKSGGQVQISALTSTATLIFWWPSVNGINATSRSC